MNAHRPVFGSGHAYQLVMITRWVVGAKGKLTSPSAGEIRGMTILSAASEDSKPPLILMISIFATRVCRIEAPTATWKSTRRFDWSLFSAMVAEATPRERLSRLI